MHKVMESCFSKFPTFLRTKMSMDKVDAQIVALVESIFKEWKVDPEIKDAVRNIFFQKHNIPIPHSDETSKDAIEVQQVSHAVEEIPMHSLKDSSVYNESNISLVENEHMLLITDDAGEAVAYHNTTDDVYYPIDARFRTICVEHGITVASEDKYELFDTWISKP